MRLGSPASAQHEFHPAAEDSDRAERQQEARDRREADAERQRLVDPLADVRERAAAARAEVAAALDATALPWNQQTMVLVGLGLVAYALVTWRAFRS